MRRYVAKPGHKLGPYVERCGIKALAEQLNVTPTTVGVWVRSNYIPVAHMEKVSKLLGVDILQVMQLADGKYPTQKRAKKAPEDLDTILKAYRGEPYEIKPPMTAKTLDRTLKTMGDKVPVIVETLKKLQKKEIMVHEAATLMGLSVSTVHNLRARYGLAPGPCKKKPKPPGVQEVNALKAHSAAIDVIAGKCYATDAVGKYKVAKRTLHRCIASLLNGYTLKDLAHWPNSFRLAYAYDIDKEQTSLVPDWIKKCKAQGWVSKELPVALTPITDWRHVTTRRMLFSVLYGELTVSEIAELRGGEALILQKLFDMELQHLGLTFKQVMEMSTWHQMAIAEMLNMSGRANLKAA